MHPHLLHAWYVLHWVLSDFRLTKSELGDVVYWREEYSTEDILKILMTEVICYKALRTAKIPKLLLVEKVQVYIRLTLQVLLEFLPGRLEGIERVRMS